MSLRIERIWAMPNKNTFDILPIKQLLSEEVDNSVLWIDPFANINRIARITNDLNPEFDTDYHLDALDFLKQFDTNSVGGCSMIHHILPDKSVSAIKTLVTMSQWLLRRHLSGLSIKNRFHELLI